MPDGPTYAAIDLGASTGRVLTGRLSRGRVVLTELHRFPNRPVVLPDGLHWDLVHLLSEAVEALRAAPPVNGVGVDSWGVDYGLLDGRSRLLGVPFHYRDARTEGMVARALGCVPPAQLYDATGIQLMPINTVFQLLAEADGPALAAAERIALVPDLVAYWLSGELANERTAASTSGLLDARSGTWAIGLIERLGLPVRIFGPLVDPGATLGPMRAAHGLGRATIRAVAGHDTAAAFVAAPVRDARSAILSSGTWSLLGLELPGPVLTDAARDANLTNERGVDGTTRLLKNVMGLWLEQECARAWGARHEELHVLAAQAGGEIPLFDPDEETLLAPGDMPERIAAACRSRGQAPPADRAAVVRSIHVSLACKYRFVLEDLEHVAGIGIERIHVIGGGARVAALCRLTAEVTGREVLAGPVEATALGNVLVQARADGELGGLGDLRAVAAASADCLAYPPPDDRSGADATYNRFLDVTGVRAPARKEIA